MLVKPRREAAPGDFSDCSARDDAGPWAAQVGGTDSAGVQQELKVGNNRDGENRCQPFAKGAGWPLTQDAMRVRVRADDP